MSSAEVPYFFPQFWTNSFHQFLRPFFSGTVMSEIRIKVRIYTPIKCTICAMYVNVGVLAAWAARCGSVLINYRLSLDYYIIYVPRIRKVSSMPYQLGSNPSENCHSHACMLL